MPRSRNDEDRRQWIENDEGLYSWCRTWRATHGGSLRAFIRQNRTEIDEVIDAVLDGRKPAHYLRYGG